MTNSLRVLKLNLKQIASTIKQNKKLSSRKHPHHDKFIGDWALSRLRIEYRHKHVAYSLARGRTLEQVDTGVGLDMDIVNWTLQAMQPDSKEKLYVVVNETLTPAQQAVQSAHAVAAFLKQNPYTLWDNGHLILLKDKPTYGGDMRMNGYVGQFCERAEFVEPDLGNKITAYAVFGMHAERAMKQKVLL